MNYFPLRRNFVFKSNILNPFYELSFRFTLFLSIEKKKKKREQFASNLLF